MEAKENTTFREEEEFSKNMVSKTLFENNFQKQEPNNGPLFDISIQTHKTLTEDGEHVSFSFFLFLEQFSYKAKLLLSVFSNFVFKTQKPNSPLFDISIQTHKILKRQLLKAFRMKEMKRFEMGLTCRKNSMPAGETLYATAWERKRKAEKRTYCNQI